MASEDIMKVEDPVLLRGAINLLEEQVEAEQKEREALEETLKGVLKGMGRFEQFSAQLEGRTKQLQNELKHVTTERDNLLRRIQQKQSGLAHVASGSDAMREEVISLKKELADFTDLFEKVEKERNELKLKLQDRERVALVRDLAPHFEVPTAPGALSTNSLRSVQSDLEKLQDKARKLSDLKVTLEAENVKVKEENASIAKELTLLRTDREEMQHAIAENDNYKRESEAEQDLRRQETDALLVKTEELQCKLNRVEAEMLLVMEEKSKTGLQLSDVLVRNKELVSSAKDTEAEKIFMKKDIVRLEKELSATHNDRLNLEKTRSRLENALVEEQSKTKHVEEQMKRDHAELEENYRAVEAEKIHREEELAKHVIDIAILKEALDRSSREATEVSDQNEEAKKEISKLRTENSLLSEQAIEAVKQAKIQYEAELEKVATEGKATWAEISTLRAENAKVLKETAESIRIEKERHEEEIQKHVAQYFEAVEEISNLKTENTELLEQTADVVKVEKARHEEDLRRVVEQHDEDLRSVRDQHEEAQMKIVLLESEVKSVREQAAEASKLASISFEADRQQIVTEKEDAVKKVSNLQAVNARILEETGQAAAAEKSRYEEEISKLSSAISAAQEQADVNAKAREVEVSQLQVESSAALVQADIAARNEQRKLEAELQEAFTLCEKLKEESSTLRSENSEMKEQISELAISAAQKQKELSGTISEIAGLRSSSKASSKKAEELRRQREKTLSELASMKEENSLLRKQLTMEAANARVKADSLSEMEARMTNAVALREKTNFACAEAREAVLDVLEKEFHVPKGTELDARETGKTQVDRLERRRVAFSERLMGSLGGMEQNENDSGTANMNPRQKLRRSSPKAVREKNDSLMGLRVINEIRSVPVSAPHIAREFLKPNTYLKPSPLYCLLLRTQHDVEANQTGQAESNAEGLSVSVNLLLEYIREFRVHLDKSSPDNTVPLNTRVRSVCDTLRRQDIIIADLERAQRASSEFVGREVTKCEILESRLNHVQDHMWDYETAADWLL
ncbi:hypothetical protein NDN08_002724 [Rhodosorus marinus]|uniref:Uncharacterized protein n=1 Tax=Rhodosorus marinus TaxID=101924 RepID=A0AAV8UUI8_9RHOD|nr:hypothetical protein NDN08_002724 [Rhodosorus marinus]